MKSMASACMIAENSKHNGKLKMKKS